MLHSDAVLPCKVQVLWESYCHCWRRAPTARPIGVPTEYPSEPVRRAGVTWDAHPLLEAIAAAVPGPPIAAFDAVKSACKQGTHAYPSLPA